MMDERRLFFGAHVASPWPADCPPGRCISEECRHITLSFLGNCDFDQFKGILETVPKPHFAMAPVGIAEEVVFLPPLHSRVVAASVKWMDGQNDFERYQSELSQWLESHGFPMDKRPFFSHISIARSPFDQKQWASFFHPLPFFVQGIHLYQSMGNLQYRSLWEFPLISPFEELDHTADIAFTIRGKTLPQLHLNAQLALAFHFPSFIPFFAKILGNTLDEIVIALNKSVSAADAQIGCPFKAVSFHGQIVKNAQELLEWEMIVDV